MRRIKRPQRRKARRPFLESLEDRTVLSGGLLAVPLRPVAVAPLQAPALTASNPVATILDSPAVQDAASPASPAKAPTASSPLASLLNNLAVPALSSVAAPVALSVNLQVDVSLPGVTQIDLAAKVAVSGNQGLAAQTTLSAGVAVLGTNVLSTNTGATVGLGGNSGIALNVGTTTTLAGGSPLTLNGTGGATVGGGQGVAVGVGATGPGGVPVGTGNTPPPGSTGGGTLGQVPATLAGSSVVPAAAAIRAGGTASGVAPVTAAAPPSATGLALSLAGTGNTTADNLLPATPAGVQEATAGQAILDDAAVDTFFLQDALLFGAGNDTDLANVLVPELPTAPADQAIPTSEPVVGPAELFDGASPLLPQGDALAQGCVPFDVKSLDDALHNLLEQFQALSGDFSGLLGRLAGSPWFVAVAALAVACEVCRRKVHKERRRLLLAAGGLAWFPRLTGSGSSEVA